jgi:hypothetical protein
MGALQPAGRLDYVELFAAERTTLLELLTQLNSDHWVAPTECPAWTVKGIALPLLGDDLFFASRQRDAESSPVLIQAGDNWGELFVVLDHVNEQWVTPAASSAPPYFWSFCGSRVSGHMVGTPW